jgi:hypothetical protein
MTDTQTPKPAELSGHKQAPTPDFNVDERARARESAAITIGGIDFHRRRKNWTVTRELRAVMRDQERAGARQQKAARDLDELDGTEIDRLTYQLDDSNVDGDSDRAKRWRAKLDRLEADRAALEDAGELDDELDKRRDALDAASEQSDDVAYRMIALLLRDDDGNPPTTDFLKDELDVADVGELASKLAGGGEPDPTQADTTTATSSSTPSS